MSNMPRKLGVIYGPLAPSVGDRAPTRKLGPEGPRGFTSAEAAFSCNLAAHRTTRHYGDRCRHDGSAERHVWSGTLPRAGMVSVVGLAVVVSYAVMM